MSVWSDWSVKQYWQYWVRAMWCQGAGERKWWVNRAKSAAHKEGVWSSERRGSGSALCDTHSEHRRQVRCLLARVPDRRTTWTERDTEYQKYKDAKMSVQDVWTPILFSPFLNSAFHNTITPSYLARVCGVSSKDAKFYSRSSFLYAESEGDLHSTI